MVKLDTLNAELAEIDENLIRNELHYVEADKQIARRKEIYEALHPETKSVTGRDLINKRWNTSDIVPPVSFTEDTSSKTGESKRNVERSVQRANAFDDDDIEVLRAADVPKTEATKLARLDTELRKEALKKIATGEAKDTKEAVKAVAKAERAPRCRNIAW